MKELKFKKIATDTFNKALIACEMAFGCLVVRETDTVKMFTFHADDDKVIIDELTAAGGKLIYNRNPLEG